jgi:small acid-soluble spore protein D (minor alpha/beta-type SASP)
MARRRSRQYAFPVPPTAIDSFKAQVMKNEGYAVNPQQPNNVKYEVARTLGVPLQQGDNGHLRTEEAGRVGGQIGGAMVKEMIRIAQQRLASQTPPGGPGR